MGKHENMLRWCINKAKRETQEGKKHRGIAIVEPDKDKAKKHIEKALENLDVVDLLSENNHPDWSVIAIFYASYHSLLAILANFGYESRNQECTFATVLSLINKGNINIEAEKIDKIKQDDDTLEGIDEEPKDVVSIREYSQYEVGTTIQHKKIEELRKEAVDLITEIREEIGV